MTDVGGVKGGGEGPESAESKKKKKADSEAFRELMKVQKAREVDPEEKRKRKRPEEAEEEFKAQQTTGKPLQGEDKELEAPSPYEPTPTKGADLGATEEGTLGEEPPPPPPQYTPPPPTQAPPPEQPTPEASPEEAPVQGPSEPRAPEAQQQPPAKRVEKTAPTKKAKPKGKVPPPLDAELTTSKITVPSDEKIGEGKEAYFQAMPGETVHPEEVKKKKPEEPITGVQPPITEGAWESTRASSTDEKSKEVPTTSMPEAATSQMPGAEAAPGSPGAAPLAAPFAHLPPQVLQLFERMLGVMTVMHESGITETTIHLDNPQFAKSAFYGTQVVITEFSTAPKEFNIELQGNAQSNALFSANAADLVASFQAGNYNFKVHRVETSLLGQVAKEKKKLTRVSRKKSSGGE